MSDFKARIVGELDLSKAKSEMNQFLKSYKSNPIKIDVELGKSTNEIAKLQAKLKSIRDQKIKITPDVSYRKTGINTIEKDFQMLKNLANEIGQKKIKIAGLDSSKNENQIKSLNTQLKKLESDYKSLYNTFGNSLNKNQIGQLENIFGKASDKVNELKAKAKDLSKTFSDIKPISQLEAGTAANKTLTWLKNNTKAAKEYGDTLERLADKQRNATNTEDLKKYTKQVNSIKAEASARGLVGKSTIDEFKRAFGQIAEFVGIYGIIRNVIYQVPRQMVQAVRDINAAQIELAKVSSASQTELNTYWNEATDSAKKYGSTISDVIKSTSDWSRLGYSLDDAKKLSDVTTLLTKVGDNMTQESSSKGLISTLKGFQMQADQAESIVDKVNEVANTKPIDTSGIFAGLERSASSMSAANNTLEETIALITAANSVVQDADVVGTAFKTISMRIRGAKTDLEEAGLDTDGMVQSTSELRKELKALSGVDIMIDDSTFKSTYDILDELSDKWSELSDIQQAGVTELVAGKRQGNIMSALMSNFDIARETLDTAMNNSAGSATRELENWNKGIEASFSHFKAQFQSFSTTALDSNMFKGAIDGGTAFLNILTKILDVGGGLPAIAASIAGIMSAKGKGKQNNNYRSLNALSYKIA